MRGGVGGRERGGKVWGERGGEREGWGERAWEVRDVSG